MTTIERAAPWALAVMLLGFAEAPALSAQATPDATLSGRILDGATGDAVEGVLVRMDTGTETLTDDDGRFRVLGLRPGLHVFAVLTADCRVTWGEVLLRGGEVKDAVLRLPAAFGAAERAEQEKAERRRSHGKLVTADDIEKMHVTTVAEVIRRVAPNMVGAPTSGGGSTSIRGRARTSFQETTPEPVVVIDGVRMPGGARALDMLRPSDIAELELQPGAAGGWEFGSSGSAGVIRVTTREGSGDTERPGAEACVVPGFPIG